MPGPPDAPLVLGLHGSLTREPAPFAHDAGYCLADPESGEILALMEAEKLSGTRHDPRLDAELLGRELAPYRDRPLDLATSHFTVLREESPSPRTLPLFRGLDRLDRSRVGPLARAGETIAGRPCRHHLHLHELAHVFTAFMYRETDHERFLGLVIEGCGAFAQNSLFLVEGGRVELLGYNYPILSGNFFHQWLAGRVFDIPRGDRAARSAVPGKAMALAAYGDPDRFLPALKAAVARFRSGQYMDYRKAFCPELEAKRLSWRERVDLCAAGQALFEDLIVGLAARIRKRHGPLPVYYGGGCALSVKTNTRLREIFDPLVIPPNCGDDGMALGLASLHAYLRHGEPLRPLTRHAGLFSGVRGGLDLGAGLSPEAVERAARWLAGGEIVAFAQGPPEIGPRALCRRSLLASPADPRMRGVLNHLKGREYFRPVAPAVLDAAGPEIVRDHVPSPYMLYHGRVRPEVAGRIPAALHEDGTVRFNTIFDDDSDIARLVRRYAAITGGPPVLLNTSLNSRGRPIAATREQVTAELERLMIKHLVLGKDAYVLS